MVGASTGTKQLLTITPCSLDAAGNLSAENSKKFVVMLNPSGYSHGLTVKSNNKDTMGQSGRTGSTFSAVSPETINFDLVIDGTGVVNPDAKSPDVKTQIQQLRDVVYRYDGEKHSPNIVRLLWGSLIYFGTLESMSMEYSLFKPSGEPLRVKVKVSFSGFLSKEEESFRAHRSSPDLNHIVEVRAGDTLPLMCYRIYKNSSYYPDVARVNNLVDFRVLAPGVRLHFPPLR